MKLKFRAEKKDIVAFFSICIFILFLVAVIISNFESLLHDGVPVGLNPLPAFNSNNVSATLLIWFVLVATVFGASESYFFTREKGFGYTSEKKEDGYARWAKEAEIINAHNVEKVPYLESKTKAAGTPLVYGSDCAYVDNGESHTLVLGATGSGKTSGIIDPSIIHLMKGRESMIVTDPKGEIYEHHSAKLKELGYQIIVLNFREPQRGNCWNPYDLPYAYQKEGNFDKANELLNDLATNIVVDGKGDDPFWQNAAADYLTGIGLALFEDAPKDTININSVNLMINQGEERNGPKTYMQDYFAMKDKSSPIAINMAAVVNTAADTKAGVLTVLQQKVKTLAVTKNLSEMLSKSDFDMASIGEKPTAVFIIIQDEKTTYHSLATIFIKQCYESLITVAHKHGGALPVRTNFLVDEFANMPKFKDITTMVTAARSRHIRFTFIIQNFAQIVQTYGEQEAETIRGNCGNLIYLLTGELKALEEISKLCGDKLVRVGKDKKEETRPLITISELQRMKMNEFILIKQRCYPFKGKIKQGFSNDFGFGKGEDYFGKNVVYPEREMGEVALFDFKEFVKKKKEENTPKMDFKMPGGNNPFSPNPFAGPNPFGGVNPFASPGKDIDIDEMIKNIDRQIAELERQEKEEEEQKKKAELESKNNLEKTDSKVVKDIDIDEKENIKENVNNEYEERPIESTTLGAPKVSEIIHSNMVDFDNFEKRDKEELDNSKSVNTTSLTNDDQEDFDDFFDDFFDEE